MAFVHQLIVAWSELSWHQSAAHPPHQHWPISFLKAGIVQRARFLTRKLVEGYGALAAAGAQQAVARIHGEQRVADVAGHEAAAVDG